MCRVELASGVIGGSIIFAIMEYEIVKCCINIKCDVFIKKKEVLLLSTLAHESI